MKFHEVRIILFDVNTTVRPLGSPDCINDPFGFLADPQQYNDRYLAQSGIVSDKVRLAPLSFKLMRRNHFWRYYRTAPNSPPLDDYWSAQVPMRAILPGLDIAPSPGDHAFDIKIVPVIYFSPIGWSTNLCFTLSGVMPPEELARFMNDLRTGTPLMIDGVPTASLHIFMEISRRLVEAIFTPQPLPVHHTTVNSYAMLEITSFSGAGIGLGGGTRPLSQAGKAMLYGIVQGKEMTPSDCSNALGTYIMRPSHGNRSCAVTDYKRGTIVFMSSSALKTEDAADVANDSRSGEGPISGKHRKIKSVGMLECNASNIARAMMMFLLQAGFHARSEGVSQASVAGLRREMEESMRQMDKGYSSWPFTTWLMEHWAFKKLRREANDA